MYQRIIKFLFPNNENIGIRFALYGLFTAIFGAVFAFNGFVFFEYLIYAGVIVGILGVVYARIFDER